MQKDSHGESQEEEDQIPITVQYEKLPEFITIVVVLNTNTKNVQHTKIKLRKICRMVHELKLKPLQKD